LVDYAHAEQPQASGTDVMNSVLKKRLFVLLLQSISAVAMVVLLLLPMQCYDVYQAKRGIPVQAQVYRIEQLHTQALSYWQVTLQLDPKNHILITDVIPGDWYAPGTTAALINQLRQQRPVTLYRTRGEQYFLTQGSYAITLQPAVVAIVWLSVMAWLQRRHLRVVRLQRQLGVEKAKNRQQRSAEAMTNQFLNIPISAVEVGLPSGVEPAISPSQACSSKVEAAVQHSVQRSAPRSADGQTSIAATSDAHTAGQAPPNQAAVAFLDAVMPVSVQTTPLAAAPAAVVSESATVQTKTTGRSSKATAELC